MNKFLLTSAAVMAATLAFSPAHAEDGGVKVGVSGVYKGYVAYADQDTATATANREVDIYREDEIRLSGETTLDNGLTVGVYLESDIQAGTRNTPATEEAYAYFSGAWGRVNLGREDGAAFLLQVGAPSADSNLDGIRNSYDPVNYAIATGALTRNLNTVDATFFDMDYDMPIIDRQENITYLTPVFSGFQAGITYSPEENDNGEFSRDFGANRDDQAGDLGEAYDVAIRYQGRYEEVGVNFGAGYTRASLEANGVTALGDVDGDGTADTITADDRQAWNVGLDLDFKAFGLGASYTVDDMGIGNANGDGDRETLVIGADYTHGAFKLGASYYNKQQDLDFLSGNGDYEVDRYTGGVVYTYGPGLTFRGSVSYVDLQEGTNAAGYTNTDTEATTVSVGTQMNF